jgi:hypothetical protein
VKVINTYIVRALDSNYYMSPLYECDNGEWYLDSKPVSADEAARMINGRIDLRKDDWALFVKEVHQNEGLISLYHIRSRKAYCMRKTRRVITDEEIKMLDDKRAINYKSEAWVNMEDNVRVQLDGPMHPLVRIYGPVYNIAI